jgi:hypothetical protein
MRPITLDPGRFVCVVTFVALAVVLAVTAFSVAPALALPEGRVYEQVSPPYKGGFGATHIVAVAENGESVLFFSAGTFNGSPTGLSGTTGYSYLARRGAGGWLTTPTLPPATLLPYVPNHDVSPTFNEMLVVGKPGRNWEAAVHEGTQVDAMLLPLDSPDVSSDWEVAGMPLEALTKEPIFLNYEGADRDFCHVLLETSLETPGGGSALLTNAEGTLRPVYELARGCNGEPVSLKLLGVNNSSEEQSIGPKCTVDIGIQGYNAVPDAFNAISADGSEVFFTTCIKVAAASHQLFVRLDGDRTLEVSRPLGEVCTEVPCEGAATRPGADFAGASEDGSKVFFTTTASLVGTDTDAESDLYMATIGCPGAQPLSPPEVEAQSCEASQREVTSLVQVSHDPNAAEAAAVQGVVRTAPDGQRVYFVAHGDLLSQAEREVLEGERRPVPRAGADNLYVYDDAVPNGKLSFIADLCSGYQASGVVEDSHCLSKTGNDLGLWGAGSEAQTAGADGGFLVFTTYAQLVSGDTDSARDVYRYDAVTGELNRVSIGEVGYDANGNDSAFNAEIVPGNYGGSVVGQYEMNNRAISEDGSRIVFGTAEPLSPQATNHLVNVYEWHEGSDGQGSVTLISGGSALQSVEDVVISPDGNNVFFQTVQGLVPQDTDGEADIYDARLGESGFPPPLTEARPCEGEACYGALTNPAPLLVPGSVPQVPGGNFPSLVSKLPVKIKHKAKAKKKIKPKRKHGKKADASGRSGKARKATGRSGR